MRRFECEFEAETLAAVVQGRWPERVDAQLCAHIATCEICSDVLAVGSAFDADSDDMRAGIAVPDASRVWWVAQLRARREAVKAAGRPITVAQLVTFACAVGLLGACVGATSKWFQTALRRVAESAADVDLKALFGSTTALVAEHGVLIAAMAALVFLIPTAVYVVLGRD